MDIDDKTTMSHSSEYEAIDRICAERGFGEQLLYVLQNDMLSGMEEREFIVRGDPVARIESLKRMLQDK